MPNQPPSDRTRAKGGPPSPEFWILTSGFSPNMRNEPNLPPNRPAHDQKMQNEPNFRCSEQILTTNDWRLKTAFNETNPICPHGHPAPRPKKCETNPISTPSCLLPIASCLYLCETNPITIQQPKKCETNPIYATPA